MTTKSEMKVEKVDDKYILTQVHIKELTFNEAMNTIAQIESDIGKSKQEIKKQTQMLEKDVYKDNLEENKNNLELITKLKADWEEIIEDDIASIKECMKAKIKLLKAEHGYERAKKEEKIALSNKIMQEACKELDVSPGLRFMYEIRAEFENI